VIVACSGSPRLSNFQIATVEYTTVLIGRVTHVIALSARVGKKSREQVLHAEGLPAQSLVVHNKWKSLILGW
jgi:hypothetical protein